jgi:hypothetical protein
LVWLTGFHSVTWSHEQKTVDICQTHATF